MNKIVLKNERKTHSSSVCIVSAAHHETAAEAWDTQSPLDCKPSLRCEHCSPLCVTKYESNVQKRSFCKVVAVL